MEVIRRKPNENVEPELEVVAGRQYVVSDIHCSVLGCVTFAIVGMTDKSGKPYWFSAHTFKSLCGKRADRVRAKAGTKAFEIYGGGRLCLAELKVIDGVVCVRCCKFHLALARLKPFLPYDQFEHI